MSEEYFSFKEVLRELQMEESQLKRLVSEGEIKAINDGQTVKFARSEIENIRNSKMDAGTIMMPNGNEHSEDVLLVDEVDSGAISTIEEVGSSLALEAELADESSAFVNVEDSGPLLSMEDSREENHPILNMSSEIKKSKIRDMKEDTEELVFEQSSSEDLLETGELLFDSVNQVMPKNKEEADLFTESEMGISDDYDDIDEASVKAAIDFVDSSDEEMVSTSTPKSNIHYSSVEMQRRQKVRTMAGISVGLLTFAVIALFFFFPPDPSTTVTKVNFYTVKNVSSDTSHNFTSEVTPIRKTEITASSEGTVSGLLKVNAQVKQGDDIGFIGSVSKEHQKLKKQYDSAKSTYNKYKSSRKALKKYYSKYKYNAKNKVKSDSRTTRAYKIYRRMLWYRSRGPKVKKKLEQGQKQAIKALSNGVVTAVHAQNGNNVSVGDLLYTVSDTSVVTCKFRTSKTEAQNWNKDQVIPVQVSGTEHDAIIDNVTEDNSTQPVSVWLYLRIPNNDKKISTGQQATLTYTKPGEVMAIPKDAIFSKEGKHYIFIVMVDQNKVLRREVELGKEHKDSYISVTNVYANDKIVTDNTLELEDNQDVIIMGNE